MARSNESRRIKIRAGLIVFFLGFAVLFLIPSLIGSLPKWWTKVLPSEKIHLGLDLQGGMYLLLEVEVQKAVENALGDPFWAMISVIIVNTWRGLPFFAVSILAAS